MDLVGIEQFQPLEVSNAKLRSICMNFIRSLSKTQYGYDITFVIVNQLTKIAHSYQTTDNDGLCCYYFVHENLLLRLIECHYKSLVIKILSF